MSGMDFEVSVHAGEIEEEQSYKSLATDFIQEYRAADRERVLALVSLCKQALTMPNDEVEMPDLSLVEQLPQYLDRIHRLQRRIKNIEKRRNRINSRFGALNLEATLK